MKSSLIILAFFVAGIILGRLDIVPQNLAQSELSLYVLWLMLFCAGMGVGFDLKALSVIRSLKARILLVPLCVVLGTVLGGLLAGLLLPGISPLDSLAVASGFGYYSLSSVIITEMGEPALGSMALLANMIRELATICLAPLMLWLGGRMGPIMSGGATSMDSSLPAILRVSGERYGVLAIFSGVCLTIIVPFFVPVVMELRALLL